jgi:hypothetical protein
VVEVAAGTTIAVGLEDKMNVSQSLPRALALSGVAAVLALSVALAQPAKEDKEFKPEVGQEGKDVIWVPTPQPLVDAMLNIAKVTANDYVIDLGSGDGRTVITAAKRGAKALGIEYNPNMVELSKRNAETAGVSDRATFKKADIFESDFSEATVITLFLLPNLNVRLRPTILKMKPGTRIVSNAFDMGDWEADDTVQVTEGCNSYCMAYFWIVPARAAGTWTLPQGTLTLSQKYQMLSGTLKSGNATTKITGKMRGDEITFVAGNTQYTGKLSGNTIEGVAESKWKATRK